MIAAGCGGLGDPETAPAPEASTAAAIASPGVSNGYTLPRNKQGVGDPYMFFISDPQWQQRYAVFRSWDIGLKAYNLFWNSFEPSQRVYPGYVSRATAPFQPSQCPPDYTPFPTSAAQKTALGLYRYHCYHQPGINMYDANFRKDAESGIQTAVVLWSAPSQAQHPGCEQEAPASIGGLADMPCVPYGAAGLQDYEDHIAFLASRYNGANGVGKISHYIIWNEVDSALWFNMTPLIPKNAGGLTLAQQQLWTSHYATLIRTAEQAIRRFTTGVLVHASLTSSWFPVPLLAARTHIGGVNVVDGLWRELGVQYDWSIAFHAYGDLPNDGSAENFNFYDQHQIVDSQRQRLLQRGLNPEQYPQAYIINSEQGWQQSVGIDMQARNICLAHAQVMSRPNFIGTTHNGLQEPPPPFGPGQDSPSSYALIRFGAGMNLAGRPLDPTVRAYDATSLSNWGRNDVHYCCAAHLVGCAHSAGPASVRSTSRSAIVDFTGDGRADLAEQWSATGAFWVHANLGSSFDGAGHDWAWGTTSAGPDWEILTADFNRDGRADYADLYKGHGEFWVHRNRGFQQSFDPANWAHGYAYAGPYLEYLVGDFDGDGFADIASRNIVTGGIGIKRNLGTGGSDSFRTLNANAGRSTVGPDWRVLIADFNGDGLADFADHHVPSGQFWAHYNLGPAQGYTFDPVGHIWVGASGGSDWTVLVGDFTGDRRADYADFHIPSGQLWVHRGVAAPNGALSFEANFIEFAATGAKPGSGYRLLGQLH